MKALHAGITTGTEAAIKELNAANCTSETIRELLEVLVNNFNTKIN